MQNPPNYAFSIKHYKPIRYYTEYIYGVNAVLTPYTSSLYLNFIAIPVWVVPFAGLAVPHVIYRHLGVHAKVWINNQAYMCTRGTHAYYRSVLKLCNRVDTCLRLVHVILLHFASKLVLHNRYFIVLSYWELSSLYRSIV